MAKTTINPLLERIRGKIGGIVFRRFQGSTVLGRRPNREGVVPTAAQTQTKDRFRQAVAYGRAAFADPLVKAEYLMAAKTRGTTGFALAVADFFHPPEVRSVDLSKYHGEAGQPIVVHVLDDFRVMGVQVDIRDTSGTVIERGSATEVNGAWRYLASTLIPIGQSVTVVAQANDRPGNIGIKAEPTIVS